MTRGIALALTVITGFTALVYQVAWQKYTAALLGSHSEATAVVLGIFLGGLSYGYALFGRVSRRLVKGADGSGGHPRLLQTYGAVEAGIGLYALLFPALFLAVRAVSLRIPQGSDVVAFAVDIVLVVVLIGPPAVLMGGTIPLLTQALSTGIEDATRFHALVYACNTVGAFAGALCGGFFLVPHLGLRGVVLAMGAINIGAGLAFVALERSAPRAAPQAADAKPLRPSGLPTYAMAALLGGFAMMTLQTAVNRVAAFSIGGSPFTFSMVVAIFVLCIALGSFAVSALDRIHRSVLAATQWALALYLLLLFPLIPDSPYAAHVVRSLFRSHAEVFYPYQAALFGGMLLVLIVPLGLSGAMLPLIFHHLRREVGDLGGIAGRIYSWNTVGSLIGALVGGYALLFWLDLHQVYRLAVVAVAAGALLLTARTLPRLRVAGGVAFAVAFVVLAALPAWAPEKLAAGSFRTREPTTHTYRGPTAFYDDYLLSVPEGQELVAFYDDDPTASIAVLNIHMSNGISHAVITNGKNDSALPGDHLTTGLLGLLPALLAGNGERAFVVGYGTGLTVGELAGLESMREVVVAEISRGVIRAAPIFEPDNRGAASNPKTRILRSDAYRALLRTEGTFDVIASEPSNPWVAGIEQLYSRDFLLAVHERLSADGVYSQWFHTYETDVATMALILNTFRSVFDNVAVWYGKRSDVLMLGFKRDGDPIDMNAVESRWSRADFRAAFGRLGIDTLPALLAHEALPLGTLDDLELPPQVHTVLQPTLAHTAARAFFEGGKADLPPALDRRAAEAGARNSLFRRYLTRHPRLDDEQWDGVIEQTCAVDTERCAAMLARWQFEDPDSPALARRVELLRQFSAATDFAPANLAQLATLFDEQGTANLPPTYDYAKRVYDSFTRYYHHAVPFDADALHGPWQRCVGDPRCAASLDRVLAMGVSLPLPAAR